MRKEEVITALKTKYLGFALSNEAVDRIASVKEKTVTEETDIETAISDAETMELIANEVKKVADRERRSRSDLQKTFDDYKKNHPEEVEEPGKEKGGEEEPEWAKNLREKMERREAEESRRETLESVKSALKSSGCTQEEVLRLSLVGFSMKEGETQDQAVARIKADYDASVKKIYGEGGAPAPQGGGAPGGGNDDAAIARRKAWVTQHRVDTGQAPKTN